MSITEEIEKLKSKLEQTADEKEQAEVLIELLKKYVLINSKDIKPHIDRLLQLAEKMNSVRYRAWGLHYLGIDNRLNGEYDTSINFTGQAISLFEEIKDKKGLGTAYNNLGATLVHQGNYQEGLKIFLQGLQIKEELGDELEIAYSHNNIGIIHEHQGNYPEALKSHLRALQIREDKEDKPGAAASYNNIGLVHSHQGNYPEVIKNYSRSLQLMKETGDKRGTAAVYNNIGVVYYIQDNYPEAMKNHLEALHIREAMDDKPGIGESSANVGTIHSHLDNQPEALKYYFRALDIFLEMGYKMGIAFCYASIGVAYEKQGDYPEAIKYMLLALRLGEEISHKEIVKESFRSLFNSYKSIHDFENALIYFEKYHQAESEMLGEQAQKQLTDLNFQHGMEQKKKEMEIAHLRNVELKNERDRSENLLLNILPSEVAEELKEKGTAEAKQFDHVTVLFTDFKGFTTVSERLTPQELVGELHSCFKAFDEIISKYNIEKIKTVGDAYMAASGLPVPNANHAEDVVKAAIEIRNFMLNRKKELGNNTFEMRVGLNSGKVVAGIVGVKKFAYDIWGDTVNTAARMEQNGEAGKVNISEATYQLVKDKFKCKFRGEIEAKNKGKLKMYFVEQSLI